MLADKHIEETSEAKLNLRCSWLKRVGVAGFMFFLIKGLAWLVVLFVLPYLGFSSF